MKFRKLPVEVEAQRFTEENKNSVFNWITCNHYPGFDSEGKPTLKIQTLEGDIIASLGDWIVKGIAGEFYPVKSDIFEKTYEPII